MSRRAPSLPDASAPTTPAGSGAPSPSDRAGRSRRAGFAMVTIAAASWGTWSLFSRSAHLPASVTAPIMFLVVGVVTLPWALRARRASWDRATLGLLAASAAFDGLNMLAYFAALQHTTVAIAVLTHYLAPIFIAVAAPLIERVAGRGTRPAAAVALAGLVVILEPWHVPAEGVLLGAALGVASATCYAGNVFAMRGLAARLGATRALCYHALLAGAVLAPLAAGHLGELTLASVGLLAIGAVMLGAVSGVVFTVGLIRIGSARAAVLTFIEPLVAVAVGATVWHESLHPVAAVGGLVVLGAGFQVARNPR